MKHSFLARVLLVALIGLSSCSKKEDIQLDEPQTKVFSGREAKVSKVELAKLLAKAVADERIRVAIKNEALKKFDGDFNVLFHKIKNEKIDEKTTFGSYFLTLSDDSKALSRKINGLPLLNILIPSTYIAEHWDAKAEIPLVVVRDENNKLIAFNKEGDSAEVDPTKIPRYPVLVLKDNERVVTDADVNDKPSLSGRESQANFIMSDRGVNYYFRFPELNPAAAKSGRTISSYPSGLDGTVVSAFNLVQGCNTCSQRDYIYYGIYPANLQGPFSPKFYEGITHFSITDPANFGYLDGYDEGAFTFKVAILWGNRTDASNAASSDNVKVFSINREDLFLMHTETEGGFLGIGAHQVDVVDGVKDYNFSYPITIVPWDMEKYGDRWKISIEEYDLETVFTKTIKETATFGTNFTLTAGEKDKVGTNLGTSSTTSKETSLSWVSTTGSDECGSASLLWTAPVITEYRYPPYLATPMGAKTFELNTGVTRISIETVRVSP